MNNDTTADAITVTQADKDLLEALQAVTTNGYVGGYIMEAEGLEIIARHRKTSLAAQDFQQRVEPWFRECFPPAVCNDRLERGDRLLEEVLELLQSGSYPPERVAALVDYTWGRPKGEPVQEVGGVMVTLAAYCIAHGLDMGEAGEIELARINQPEIVQKIRAKQAAKPTGSALPVAPSLAAQDGLVEENERLRKLVQTYRGAQLRAEEKLCREQANAQGWKLRAQLLDEKLDALASAEAKSS